MPASWVVRQDSGPEGADTLRPAVGSGRGACQSGERRKLARPRAALKQRGLVGGEFVVSDDHAGLKQAIFEPLPEAVWQRCDVHFVRNARIICCPSTMTIA